jgi:hypothetical protein
MAIATFDPGKSLVRVGGGRGFVVQACEPPHQHYVVSAAHCLPAIPQEGQEATFQNLLGPLGGEITVSAECVFIDPISDIAVLGTPEDDDYEALIEPLGPLKLGDAAPTETPAYLVALDGRLIDCTVHMHFLGRSLLIDNATGKIVPGMSGSPILSREGAAIGVVSHSARPDAEAFDGNEGMVPVDEYDPAPRLIANLPGWLLVDLGASSMLRELSADDRQRLAKMGLE